MSTTTPRTNRWYLSSAPIVRALVHLCVPMAAAMIVGAVYNVVNAGFVGSLDNPVLLAAITFGTPLLGLVMAVGGVFGVGGGALISRLLGASENDPAQAGEIKRGSSFALWGAVITGAVLGCLGLVFLQPLAVVGYFVVWLQRNSEHVSLSPRWFSLAPSILKPARS